MNWEQLRDGQARETRRSSAGERVGEISGENILAASSGGAVVAAGGVGEAGSV